MECALADAIYNAYMVEEHTHSHTHTHTHTSIYIHSGGSPQSSMINIIRLPIHISSGVLLMIGVLPMHPSPHDYPEVLLLVCVDG